MLYNISDTLKVMSIKKRLTAFIDHKGLSISAFERLCSLSNGFVNSSGESLSYKSLEKISKSFPELSKSWVQSGKGKMIEELSPPTPAESPPSATDMRDIKIEMMQERINQMLQREKELVLEIAELRYIVKKKNEIGNK